MLSLNSCSSPVSLDLLKTVCPTKHSLNLLFGAAADGDGDDDDDDDGDD